jgi:hypothetical protein
LSSETRDFTLEKDEDHILELSLYQDGIWLYVRGNMDDCTSLGLTPDDCDRIIENLGRLKRAYLAGQS